MVGTYAFYILVRYSMASQLAVSYQYIKSVSAVWGLTNVLIYDALPSIRAVGLE